MIVSFNSCKSPYIKTQSLCKAQVAVSKQQSTFTGLFFSDDPVKARAQKIVHTHTILAGTIAASLAQTPGLDEVPLAANDATMIGNIADNYNFKMDDALIAGTLGKMAGSYLGVKFFSKAVTWFPGIGNAVNAGVAGTVTEAVGHSFIGFCEHCKKKGITPSSNAMKNFRF